MNITAIRQQGLRAILGGEHSLEYRDRLVGLGMLVIGLIAVAFVPEYRELSRTFQSNVFGPEFFHRTVFCLSMFAVIGPCLLLPYRFGGTPIILAVSLSAYLVHTEFSEQPLVDKPKVEQVQLARESINRTALGR